MPIKDRLAAALKRTPHSPACSSRLQFQSAIGSCDCDLDDLRARVAGVEQFSGFMLRDGDEVLGRVFWYRGAAEAEKDLANKRRIDQVRVVPAVVLTWEEGGGDGE